MKCAEKVHNYVVEHRTEILKTLKELSIQFNSRLVMFTGANEETGMADIEE